MKLPTLEEVKKAIENDSFRELLEPLTRVQLLEFEDVYSSQKIGFVWNIFYEVMYEHDWPLTRETFDDFMDGRDLLMVKLEKKINGIQKKLDIISKLIENTEVTMSGKIAMSL